MMPAIIISTLTGLQEKNVIWLTLFHLTHFTYFVDKTVIGATHTQHLSLKLRVKFWPSTTFASVWTEQLWVNTAIFRNLTYEVTMTLLKTMEKFGPLGNQTNYTSFERYWWELTENVTFIEIECLNQTLWPILVDLPWPLINYSKITWSWLPILKNLKFHRVPYYIFGKVTNIQRVYSKVLRVMDKNLWGRLPKAPPPPQAWIGLKGL